MKKISNWLWGIILIVIGVVIGLNALDITNIDLFFDGWWTLFIIVPSFIGLLESDDKTGELIGLIIGIMLFLACQNIIDFSLIWKLIVPIILIMVGISFIFKDVLNKKVKENINKLNKMNKDTNEYCATFGNQNLDFTNDEFKGCNLSAVFGGIKCDLRNAQISDDIVINTNSIFGGITIYTPKDVNVKVNCTPIFGGVECDLKKNTKEAKVTIYVNATCLFGGVEIK